MSPAPRAAHSGLVAVLTAAAFLIFAQAFMIAPILPRLAGVFGSTTGVIGLAVPAYLIPYGLASLIWGPITDRIGRRPIIVGCLAAFVLVTAATATATSPIAFIGWRMLAGLVASGVVPVSVALIADVLPYRARGRALGWIFGGMAGGMAVGAAAGALAEPVVGWRGLFLTAAIACAVAAGLALVRIPSDLAARGTTSPRAGSTRAGAGIGSVLRGYLGLWQQSRARRVYAYVGLNAILQSGVYTWIGVYLHQRYGLGTAGIGLTMLGYGIPGLIFGPVIGKIVDRRGRAALIPVGVGVTAIATLTLAIGVPHPLANLIIALLSLGYDLTQPLLAGIVTDLPAPPGQAVAVMAVILFCGFGAGSLVFQSLLGLGFGAALLIFAAAATIAAGIAIPIFSRERPRVIS